MAADHSSTLPAPFSGPFSGPLLRPPALLACGAVPLAEQLGAAMPSLAVACTPSPATTAPDAPAPAATDPYRPAGDWAHLCYYHADNAALRQGPRPGAVFIGDWITRNWITIDPGFFTSARADRGSSSQTSAQMLLRFGPDGIALRPKVIHLMAGTNAIAANPGGLATKSYKANITAMADLAKAAGIALVIGAILPAGHFAWRTTLAPAEDIRALNRWLRDLAKACGLVLIDYYAALLAPDSAAPDGAAREGLTCDGLTCDGVHPTAARFAVMAALAEPALGNAVARARGLAKLRS